MKEEIFDIGDTVICDTCGEDYTNSDESGGILFGSKGVCPKCAPSLEADAKKYHEEEWIKARCPDGMSFKDWCLKLRGGDNRIIFRSSNDIEDIIPILKKNDGKN